MNNTFDSKRYIVKGVLLDREGFINEIFKYLRKYPFQDYRFITLKMEYNNSYEVYVALKEGIVKYVKENPSANFIDVCNQLKIKKEYLQELIDDHTIEISSNSNNNEILQERDNKALINELSKVMLDSKNKMNEDKGHVRTRSSAFFTRK